MNKEDNRTIDLFEYEMICDYFKTIPRQGPGSPEVTRLAAGFIGGLGDDARTADLGCGTGTQTLTLAGCIPGHITGLDLFPAFIDILNRNAASAGISDRLHGITGSMDDLPFAEGELDLIWSEGAIYNVGFADGLKLWNRYLKPGGYVAVTEASWFRPDPPREIVDFWNDNYPQIDTIPVKVAQMQEAGYEPVAYFMLPENCWTDHYYTPQQEARQKFLEKYPGNKAASDFIHFQQLEESLYRKYKEFYGYVFYIGRKV